MEFNAFAALFEPPGLWAKPENVVEEGPCGRFRSPFDRAQGFERSRKATRLQQWDFLTRRSLLRPANRQQARQDFLRGLKLHIRNGCKTEPCGKFRHLIQLDARLLEADF